MKYLKIGLIIDNLNLEDLNSELINIINKNNSFKINTLIINNVNKKGLNFYLKKYSFLRLIEKTLFKIIFLFEKNFLYKFLKKYNFSKINIQDLKSDRLIVNPIVSKNGFFYNYKEDDLNKIREKKLDVLIRLGTGILKGEILNITKHGIISFHHGDNDYNRGGPPGFWEVYFKIPKTGFIIQKLNENLDAGDVLFKGNFQTKLFYYQNRQSIYKKSAKFIEKVLLNILNNNLVYHKKNLFFNKIFKDPNFFQIFKYIISTYSNILLKVFEKILFKKIIWEVAFSKNKFNENSMQHFNVIKNDNKERFIADPFLFKKDKNNYLFVEDYSFKKKKGVISCYELKDQTSKFIGKVLEEKFHLSFPFIFEYEKKIYMCPETVEKNEIRLYQSIEFPNKWEFKMTLIKNIKAVDTLIFLKDETWWLITSTSNTNDGDYSELKIYFSDEGPLSDKWVAHKSNPIYVDPEKGRNGGILFEKKKIYRINQKIGFNLYGKGFEINEILSINKDNFKENFISNVQPNFFKNTIGTHHLNNNSEYTTFDFCKKKYFFNN